FIGELVENLVQSALHASPWGPVWQPSKASRRETSEAEVHSPVGSTLRSPFETLGEWEDVVALGQKKIIAEQIRREMIKKRVTKTELAKRLSTSRAQIE